MIFDSRVPLFSQYDLSSVFHTNIEQANKDVESITREQFVNSSDNELIEHVFSKREIIPLELYTDQQVLDHNETQIDIRNHPGRDVRDRSRPFLIPGIYIKVTIPFTGDPELWKCRPSQWKTTFPFATIRRTGNEERGEIEITLTRTSDSLGDGSDIKQEVEGTIGEIEWYLSVIRAQVEKHNEELKTYISERVADRSKRISKQEEVIKALNIPLKRRDGEPNFSKLPVKIRIVKPLFTETRLHKEPGISSEEFETILDLIRHSGRSFEGTPKTFNKMNEEELRNIILANLNTYYEGQATGETFRGKGKTDIRIESDDRSAFIAECKIWRGEAEIKTAIDQLLGYMIWRDCKATIIIFNKGIAGFTNLLSKVPVILADHPKRERKLNNINSGEWRYVFRSQHDEKRLITLHVFLFNLYVSKD